MQGEVDYNNVLYELFRVINVEREASPALLKHAAVAVDEMLRLRAREASLLEDLDRGAKLSAEQIDKLREENTVLRAAREGAEQAFTELEDLAKSHYAEVERLTAQELRLEEYKAQVAQLIHNIEVASYDRTTAMDELMRDCVNAATAVREFSWVPEPPVEQCTQCSARRDMCTAHAEANLRVNVMQNPLDPLDPFACLDECDPKKLEPSDGE